MRTTILAVGMATLILAASNRAVAVPILINFDQDANGVNINAPGLFSQTTRLTTLYSSLGVTFAGPGGNDGGAILNQSGNFGVNALSTPNFLAFNSGATLSDGGIPRGPETILFAVDVASVSLFVAGGNNADPFLLQAFDINNNLIGSANVTTQPFAQLSINVPGIRRAVLSTSGDGIFVVDNLVFDTAPTQAVPEPPTFILFGLLVGFGLIGCVFRRRFAMAG